MQRLDLDFVQRLARPIPLAVVVAALLFAGPVLATHAPVAESTTGSRPAYRSAFDGYRAFRDEPLSSWRDVNREVGRLGGHAGALGSAGGTSNPPSGDARPETPARPSTTSEPGTAPAMVRPGAGMHRH